jgi:hypothetical protein
MSMNLMQPRRFWILLAKVTLSSTIDHWISYTIASLMHEKMNSASLQIEVLNQFHMNVSCMVTLSCLKYSMKFKRHCFGVNLHGQSESLQTSLVDLAWLMIFGTTIVVNSSNLVKVKFVNVLNNLGVVCNVARMPKLQHLGLLTN